MILLELFLLVTIIATYMLNRNRMVYNYRHNIVDAIHHLNKVDHENGIPYDGWRYEVYEAVSYDAMVYKFWKRLDSFYPDKSFITEKGK